MRSSAALSLVFALNLFSNSPKLLKPSGINVWNASPQVKPVASRLENITLRQVIHLARAENGLYQFGFSNLFGRTTVEITGAAVSYRKSKSEIIKGSVHQLTFNGMANTLLTPGTELESDWINLELDNHTDLAIDIYFRRETYIQTIHVLSNTTSYLSTSGEHLGQEIFPVSSSFENWYLLSNAKFKSKNEIKNIVVFGDSITDGAGSQLNSNERWTDFLQTALQKKNKQLVVVNAGISGNKLLSDGASLAGIKRFNHDVLSETNVKAIIVLEGINDIGQDRAAESDAPIAKRIIQGYRELISLAHAEKIKIIGGTLTPIGGSGYDSPAHEQARTIVNQWIRTSQEFDAFIDFDSSIRDPKNLTKLRQDYDSGDHLHPSSGGYKAMASAINLDEL